MPPTSDPLVGAVVGHRLDQRGDHRRRVDRAHLGRARARAVSGVGDGLAHHGPVDGRAHVGEVVVGRPPARARPAAARPGRCDRISTTSSRFGRERDQLDVADRGPGQRGVLHDRDLAGQLREQPHRAVHHVVEVDRAVEEGGDRALLGGAHRLERGQPVDEQPVALVGRDPAGAGVRLGDEPLLLQRRHVVADGGRRDAERVPLDQRLGADRLLGGDVVLDDGAQHGELAVVLHCSPPSRLGTRSLALVGSECQAY